MQHHCGFIVDRRVLSHFSNMRTVVNETKWYARHCTKSDDENSGGHKDCTLPDNSSCIEAVLNLTPRLGQGLKLDCRSGELDVYERSGSEPCAVASKQNSFGFVYPNRVMANIPLEDTLMLS